MSMAILVVLTALFGAAAAQADPLAECVHARNSEARLQACSDVIAGGRYSNEQKAAALRNRASSRTDAGAGVQGIADYDEAIRLAPGEAAGYSGRGRARVLMQDIDGALNDFTEALRVGPATPSVYASRGHARFVKGDLEGAVADFTEAIRLNPKSASAFNRRGPDGARSHLAQPHE